MTTRISATVTKAVDILDLFISAPEGLSVTRIALATRIHKSTVARLCATLEKRGYLRRDARSAYFVGPQLDRLARVFRDQFNLESLVRPQLARLRDETGESASLYVADGDARVCLLRENSQHAIRHVVEEGARLPFNEGVVGRVLLAFAGSPGPDYASIREQGYLDAVGREAFTASVAVPLLAHDGALFGAIVVSGLMNRFDASQRGHALLAMRACCAQLREDLPSPTEASA
jgi:DNA-binding IclR family transcriptional regulator